MSKASPCYIHTIDKYTGESITSIPVTSGGFKIAISQPAGMDRQASLFMLGVYLTQLLYIRHMTVAACCIVKVPLGSRELL